jgi:hypothetical protein
MELPHLLDLAYLHTRTSGIYLLLLHSEIGVPLQSEHLVLLSLLLCSLLLECQGFTGYLCFVL